MQITKTTEANGQCERYRVPGFDAWEIVRICGRAYMSERRTDGDEGSFFPAGGIREAKASLIEKATAALAAA
jgi:hypothetical protein